jgi:cell division septation protein DedD
MPGIMLSMLQGGPLMLQDRRQYERLMPNSPQLVLLDESKYSLLFDLSEGGLALEGHTAKNPQDVITLEFDLPEGNGCISARAEVAWMSGSGYRSGLRFIEMPDASRQHLREWISSVSLQRSTALEIGVESPAFTANQELLFRPAPPEVNEEDRAKVSNVPAMPQRFNYNASDEDDDFYDGRAGHLAAVVVSVILMSSLAFLMGYYWHQGRVVRARRAAAVAARAASATKTLVDSGSPVDTTQSTSPSPASPAPLSLDSPGFVLQIAAMANEGNADAVSATLRQKNFPAFVFKHSADSLYRVAIGPFSDADSAAKTKSELEQQGFKPILKNWTPQ